MADINKLMQIINALEAQGMDVESILGGLLAPAPYPAVGIREDGMSPGPGVGSVSQGDIDMMMNRMPQMQPGTGSVSQRDMDMMRRRMPGQGQSRSGILELLQRMR